MQKSLLFLFSLARPQHCLKEATKIKKNYENTTKWTLFSGQHKNIILKLTFKLVFSLYKEFIPAPARAPAEYIIIMDRRHPLFWLQENTVFFTHYQC